MLSFGSRQSAGAETERQHGEAEERGSRESETTEIEGKETETSRPDLFLCNLVINMMKQSPGEKRAEVTAISHLICLFSGVARE